MKINGQEVSGPNVETLVLPRGNGNDIVIQCRAVPDFDEFNALVKMPEPPMMLVKGEKVPDLQDQNFREMGLRYGEMRVAYMVVRSLEETEIEWDTVDINDPKTWANYTQDFKESGVSELELDRIVGTVMQANALDEKKLEQARALFLLGQRLVALNTSGQLTEPESSQSGKPAND